MLSNRSGAGIRCRAGKIGVRVLVDLDQRAVERVGESGERHRIRGSGKNLAPLMHAAPASARHHQQVLHAGAAQILHRRLRELGPLRDQQLFRLVHEPECDPVGVRKTFSHPGPEIDERCIRHVLGTDRQPAVGRVVVRVEDHAQTMHRRGRDRFVDRGHFGRIEFAHQGGCARSQRKGRRIAVAPFCAK